MSFVSKRTWLPRLTWWEPFWIASLAPILLLPGRLLPLRLHPLSVLALFLFWPLHLLHQRRLTPRTPLDWPLALLVACFPVSLWASVDRVRSWEVAGYLLLGIAIYVALVNWPVTRQRPHWIGWAVIALATALSLLGPLLFVDAAGFPAVMRSIIAAARPITDRLGENINPNILASALLPGFAIALALVLQPGWTSRRWLPMASAVLAAWLLVVITLAQSRSALLAAVVIVMLLLVLRWPRLLYATPVLIIAVVALLSRVGSGAILDALTTSSTTAGLVQRVEIWQRAFFALHDFPFTGIGLGLFGRVIPLLYPYLTIAPSIEIPHAHNLLLQIGADLGLPGLVAYGSLQLCLIGMLATSLRRHPDSLAWPLAAGALAYTIGALAGGLFDVVSWGSKLAFAPWLLVALATIVHLKHQRVDRCSDQSGSIDR